MNGVSNKSADIPAEDGTATTWKKLSFSLPFAVEGAASCVIDGVFYSFGGSILKNDEKLDTNSLVCWKMTADSEPIVVNISGELPPARTGAILSGVCGELLLFGGLNQDCGWLGDFWKFDVKAGKWSPWIPSGRCSAPSPRDKMASTQSDGKVYIFGGFGPIGTGEEEESEGDSSVENSLDHEQEALQIGWFDQLFVIDMTGAKWELSQPMIMSATRPAARAAPSLVALGTDRLVLFGGRVAEGRLNDLHSFSIKERKWCAHSVSSVKPAARSFHSACAVGEDVIVFGGRAEDNAELKDLWIFRWSSKTWQQVSCDGPSARACHSFMALPDSSDVFLLGGSTGFDESTMSAETLLSDIWQLKLSSMAAAGDGDLLAASETATSLVNGKRCADDVGLSSPEKLAKVDG